MRYRTLNPATGELLEQFPLHDDAHVERVLEAARAAWRSWQHTDPGTRADALEAAARRLEEQAEDLARLLAIEMGKPLAQGRAEALKCAWGCRHYAEHGERYLADESIDTGPGRSFVRSEPLGPVFAIMPWNFPLWQLFRFAAPAFAAGNVVVMKHAPNVPRTAEAIAALLRGTPLPEGAFSNLRLTNEQAARVIGDPRVRGVTLTGSTRAGREVAAVAGRHLKPCVLELGGSDPFVVFEDSDLEEVVEAAVAARCQNSGQSCIAAKRFLVQRSVEAPFRERLARALAAQVVGDPLDERTQIGPLAREDLRATLAGQVERSVAQGARVVAGGTMPPGPGFFYPPTLLAEIPDDAPVRREELFGPVAALFGFDEEEDAVRLANDTAYGLGASLWTADEARVARLTRDLEAGSVFAGTMVRSDPRLPFGGIKDSGIGRELGRDGILAFTNRKTVHVA